MPVYRKIELNQRKMSQFLRVNICDWMWSGILDEVIKILDITWEGSGVSIRHGISVVCAEHFYHNNILITSAVIIEMTV